MFMKTVDLVSLTWSRGFCLFGEVSNLVSIFYLISTLCSQFLVKTSNIWFRCLVCSDLCPHSHLMLYVCPQRVILIRTPVMLDQECILQSDCILIQLFASAKTLFPNKVTLRGTDIRTSAYLLQGFPGGSYSIVSACNAGASGLIPGLGRSPGEGNGYPFQYSCLENSMD